MHKTSSRNRTSKSWT